MNKNILHIPSLSYFNNDWDELQRFLKCIDKPPFHFDGYLNLYNSLVWDLGNLTSVGGSLYLHNTPISKTMTKDDIRSQVNVEDDIFF